MITSIIHNDELLEESSNIIEYKNGEIVDRSNKNNILNKDINIITNEKCKQIFRKDVPLELLYKILNVVAEKHDDYYLITKVCYKKADYNNKIKDFLIELKDYYFQSKVYFVERKLDYIKFIRIIKQLCNYHNIKVDNKFIYNSSHYEIDYFIYLVPKDIA